MKCNIKIKIFFLVLVAINLKAQQKQITNQNIYWLRYYNQVNFGNKISWHNEFDNRRFIKNNKQFQFIMHSRIHYKFWKNADFGVGFTYSRQSQQEPSSKSTFIIPELRTVQEINLNNPITNRFSIHNRIRIDERFIRKTDGNVLNEGYNFNARFRYRLQTSYRLNKNEKALPTIFKMSNEIMINAGKKILYNYFDQNRVYIALEQSINKNFSMELGFIKLFQQRTTGNQFYERNIIRYTLYHRIKLNTFSKTQ